MPQPARQDGRPLLTALAHRRLLIADAAPVLLFTRAEKRATGRWDAQRQRRAWATASATASAAAVTWRHHRCRKGQVLRCAHAVPTTTTTAAAAAAATAAAAAAVGPLGRGRSDVGTRRVGSARARVLGHGARLLCRLAQLARRQEAVA